MAFELCQPGEWKAAGGLPEGSVSLQKNGRITVRTEDLELIGIKREDAQCAVLCCQETSRIAIRRMADGETAGFALHTPTKKKGHKVEHLRVINVNVPLRKLGIEAAAYAGRYELATKDDLLLLNLMGLSTADKKLARPHPDAAKKAAAAAGKK